eukprot:gene5100-6347_t
MSTSSPILTSTPSSATTILPTTFDDIFKAKEFNPKSWINSVLNTTTISNESTTTPNNNKLETELESISSTLLSQLQIYSLELNISLESITSESLLVVPKAIREIDKIRKESLKLKTKIKSINQKIEQMHCNTSETVALISKLDLAKMRIDQSIRSLKEAEKLLSFSSQVDALFASNDYAKITETLEDVRQSLAVLSDVPEFRAQSAQFSAYQDRLETLLRPQLVSVFANRDIDSSANYLKIFRSIRREDQFFQQYYNTRLDPIKTLWNSYNRGNPLSLSTPIPSNPSSVSSPPIVSKPTSPYLPHQQQHQQSSSTAPTEPFNTWLSKFFDQILLLVNSEHSFISQLSPDNYKSILENLVIHLFNSIHSQFQSRIDAAIQQQLPTTGSVTVKISDLLSLYKMTCQFLKSLPFSVPTLPSTAISTTPSTSSPLQESYKLYKTVLEPFKYFQSKFSDYEIRQHKQTLNLLSPIKKNDYDSTTKNMENLSTKVFIMAQSSIDRFFEFTHCTELSLFINVLNTLITDYTVILKDSLNELKTIANINTLSTKDLIDQLSNKNTTNLQKQHSKTPSSSSNSSSWEYFQGAMKLLQNSNSLVSKIIDLDNHFNLNIQHYLSDESNQMESMIKKILLLDLNKLHKLQSIVEQIELNLIASVSGSHPHHSLKDKKLLLQEGLNQICTYYSLCQNFVFEIMISFIRTKLKEVPKMAEWKSNSNSTINVQHPHTDSHFSTPSISYITQIADHLLTIPQQLDPYSEEESLRFSTQIALSYPINDDFYQNLIKQYHQSNISTNNSEEAKEEGVEGEEEEEDFMDGIAHQWITLVAKATEKLYLQSIIEISSLTDMGSQQLHNDIGYLFNVLSALGVPPDALLLKTQSLITMPKDTYLDHSSTLTGAERNISNLIGKMRNIK